ncbi:hypothetical protein U9M48_021334 [Paspalum notatum var. saurae]|uniref:K Homology domain-containing protein n=1 Tax=Paspalum notatum var. saurae TaxID=547442 RepID=A0AAQ3TJC9_PASNO
MASRMTPSKRPFQRNSSDHNGRGKWQKTRHSSSHKPQLKIEPGVPSFRILCPASKSGNVIGKEGSIIAKIRKETGVKIRVDRAAPGCDERVVFIVAVDKDEEASSEKGGQNNGGAAISACGGNDKGGSEEKKDDPEKNRGMEEKDDSQEDNNNGRNDDPEKANSNEQKGDFDKVHVKEENDDPEKDSSTEHKGDSERENIKEEKDDFEKDRIKEEKGNSEKGHIKEEKGDLEKDQSKEEKDDPFVAKGAKSEPVKAVLLVFDRIFAAEDDHETGDASGSSTPVSVRLLVLYSQAGWLLGKGGSVVKQMSVDNGCEIRVSKDMLPSCASSNDRLCQITGEIGSVRKGLSAVAELLLAHPPKKADFAAGVHSSGSSSRSSFSQPDGLPSGMQSNFHIPLQGPSEANGPFGITDLQPNIASFPIVPEAQIHGHPAVPIEPLSFRLLCPKDKVGSIIGKGGNIVKTIQNDTGCEIKVLDTVPKTDDRIISISGPAHPGDGISPAQNAILHVQRKIVLPTSDKKEAPAICRLIVSRNQVGCLLGKGGSIIAEMRKLSGAFIVVLSKDKIPRGVAEHDEVIQISGGCEAIQEALMQITARLRNHLFRDRMPAMGPNMRPPFGLSDSQFVPFVGNHEPPSMFHKDFMGHALDGTSAPWTAKGMHDVGDPVSISDIPRAGHREHGGFSGPAQSSMMPKLTAEVLVPRLVIPALCGEDGGCLDRIREFSEAKITVAEPIGDAVDTTVIICGTPDQMHAARSLVQAFVISESFAA